METSPWNIEVPGIVHTVAGSHVVLYGRWSLPGSQPPGVPLTDRILDLGDRIRYWRIRHTTSNESLVRWMQRFDQYHLIILVMDIAMFGRLAIMRQVIFDPEELVWRFHLSALRRDIIMAWYRPPIPAEWRPIWPDPLPSTPVVGSPTSTPRNKRARHPNP
jgi:hypothetical protein